MPAQPRCAGILLCVEDPMQVEFRNSGLEPLHAMQTQLAPAVAKKFLTFLAKEAASDRNNVIALFEDEFARDQTGAPFIDFVSMLAAVASDIFLRDAVNYRANSGPH